MTGLIISEFIVFSLLAFALLFLLIFLVRFILIFLIERSYKKYLAVKKVAKKILPKSKKNFIKEDEELKRNLELPRAHSEVKAEKRKNAQLRENGSYELMESDDQEENDLNESQIVDFVRPIGFWTSMILGQKLTYLVQSAQILNKRGDKGFWTSMIEAKDRAAGRQQGRGR
jgi:hypothetical protein